MNIDEFTKKLEDELKKHVKEKLAGHAYPREFEFVDKLPKTRSGKIMRRILKVIAEGNTDYGNIMTLADPSVVDVLAKDRVK